MRIPNPQVRILHLAAAALTALPLTCTLSGIAQAVPRQQELTERLDRMERRLDATERELAEERAAIAAMRQQMQLPAQVDAPDAGAAPLQQAVAELREQQSVEQAEIAVHEQTKVETRSRYALKLGGLALFNGFENIGAVDSADVPVIAVARTAGASHGSVGASMRQSLITLDATGPQFAGARTYANVQMDFFGGLSTADYTSTAGTVRMRTASIETEWPGFNVHAGLERLLIAPSSPTSYASLGEPAMAWSGNLWAWTPQIAAEKTFSRSETGQWKLAAALADIPDPGPASSSYVRTASAAESSRYPGAEMRAGYAWGRAGKSTTSATTTGASTIGASGYWSKHDYGVSGRVNAWAALTDWRIALPARFTFSGEAYKGEALGGLGGGAFKDVGSVYSYGGWQIAPIRRAVGLRDAGGWAELKFEPGRMLELNGALGVDNDWAGQLRASDISLANPYSGLARNRTFLSNAIYRPRASFLLSLEYRRLDSWQLVLPANHAQVIGLAAGYEF